MKCLAFFVYKYDNLGRKTKNNITTNYTYDKNNKLLKEGNISYTYDNARNLIKKQSIAETTDDKIVEYKGKGTINRDSEILEIYRGNGITVIIKKMENGLLY